MHCAISPTRDKRPFNLLFYKPPTSARNILKIVELGFSQFCLLCALVRLWVELTCIRQTKIFQPMMARTPETYPVLRAMIIFTIRESPPEATVKNLKADVSSVRPSSERLGNDKWSEWNFVCQAQVCDLIDINTILPKAYRIVISKSISYLWIVCFQSSMEM